MEPALAFRALIPRFYRQGIRSHRIVQIAKILGIPISTASVMGILRSAREVQAGTIRVGSWAKRHGPARWIGGQRVAKTRVARDWFVKGDLMFTVCRWKIRGVPPALVNLARTFAAWWNYVQIGGELDLDAIASGEKPP